MTDDRKPKKRPSPKPAAGKLAPRPPPMGSDRWWADTKDDLDWDRIRDIVRSQANFTKFSAKTRVAILALVNHHRAELFATGADMIESALQRRAETAEQVATLRKAANYLRPESFAYEIMVKRYFEDPADVAASLDRLANFFDKAVFLNPSPRRRKTNVIRADLGKRLIIIAHEHLGIPLGITNPIDRAAGKAVATGPALDFATEIMRQVGIQIPPNAPAGWRDAAVKALRIGRPKQKLSPKKKKQI